VDQKHSAGPPDPREEETKEVNPVIPPPGDTPDKARPEVDSSEIKKGKPRPEHWRVRLELVGSQAEALEVDVGGDVVVGRDRRAVNFVDLSDYRAEKLGVSRSHIMLRPTDTHLFIIDLGSTNGTTLNGHSIGVNTPYALLDDDLVALGNLQFKVRIVGRPAKKYGDLVDKTNPAQALSQIAKAVTSQLDLDEVLSQALEMAVMLTEASEATIWLVDESTGEIFMEAERGVEDEQFKRMRLPVTDTWPGKVIKTGQPMRASREIEDEQIKIKTGYLVSALLYVPLTLGGVTFGVLGAAHREPGKRFTLRDEQLLAAIGDFAAIAVQNARVHGATNEALTQRVGELASLNDLSQAVSASLELENVYEALIRYLRQHWSVETISLWLAQDDTNELSEFVPSAQPGGRDTPALMEKLVEKTARRGEPVLLAGGDLGEAHRLSGTDTRKLRSGLGVPIKHQNEVVGVLCLEDADINTFTQANIFTLMTASEQIAVAIKNAQLYQGLEKTFQQLQHADQLKMQMIQNISHEFRTPLQFIVGYLGLMLDQPDMEGDLHNTLKIIAEQANKLTSLVDNFVSLESSEDMASKRISTQVSRVLRGTVEGARLQARQKQIALKMQCESDLPPVMINIMGIYQVLDNLVTNALKFTPERGEIVLKAARAASGDQVHISVSDTGIGIKEEEHEKIFERFYQVDGSSRRKYKGVGLGLAVCKDIVEAHGGKIWVESSPGKGTTFTFSLPVAAESPDSPDSTDS
jgi:signal transduction histidine kinase/pSer/pThr/pTyr-binding forkhead associated (FHA) protein